MQPKPLLSILCITYNHNQYISAAIKSFLNQKTTFAFEIIIADDASTDNSQIIIQDYYAKNPDIIKPILRSKNIGAQKNWIEAFNLCQGKYIALCEGDDYWTDPYKLQKQVDFLEKNEEYIISFHNSIILKNYEKSERILLKATNYTPSDIFLGSILPTQTVLFRNIISTLPESFSKVYNGDTYLFCWLANQSNKGAYFHTDIEDSVYRVQNNGVWSSLSMKKKYSASFNTMKILYKDFPRFRKEILFRLQQMNMEFNIIETSFWNKLKYSFEIMNFCIFKKQFGLTLLLFRRIFNLIFSY